MRGEFDLSMVCVICVCVQYMKDLILVNSAVIERREIITCNKLTCTLPMRVIMQHDLISHQPYSS